MADRTIPLPTSTRTEPAPDAGGGGGGGDPFKEWVELPLDPSDGWTVVDGAGVGAGTSLAKVGSNLIFSNSPKTSLQIQGSTMKGKAMIRSQHIQPWADAGVPQPAGWAANIFQPEMMTLKIEVQFDTDGGGPINGDASNDYGLNLCCIAGLIGYNTDQGGNPTAGGTGPLWLGAMVEKNLGNQPSGSTSPNLYKGGYRTYFTNGGTTTGYSWKNMQSPPAGAHDSIVFATPPLRKEPSATGRADIFAGSYASDQPFYPMAVIGQTIFDAATRLSSTSTQNFWHICVWFGGRSNTAAGGEIRIKKIRYILQPLQNRAALK